jgi:hypothetical protein
MKRTTLEISLLAAAMLLSACGAPASTPAPTSPAAPTSTQLQATATAADIDPCVLIPAQEASALAGVSFGPGVEGSVAGGEKTCTYGGNTSNVVVVNVIQAPDVDTAKAAKDAFLADLQANLQQLTSQGFTITQLPDFADGATYAEVHVSVQGITVNGSAIAVMKGTIFFGFSDTVRDNPAPDSTAVQAEATTVLGRLP